jgi:hypothetical protein
MLIPRHWARAASQAETPDGRHIRFHVWRGSRGDPAEAEALASEAVERIADRIRRGAGFPERYSYGDRPLQEEVTREYPSADGGDAPAAAITRNSYGALVLNTARVCFIDVDLPPVQQPASPSPLWGILERLLGRPAAEVLPAPLRSLLEQVLGPASRAAAADPADAALGRLRGWVAAHPEWRVRVYRTHSGLRYLATHDLLTPTDAVAQAAMSAVGADPQYIQLCRAQKSFRARLTPKPWRVGIENPPARFPFESAAEESEMREWISRYTRASEGRATCRFLEEIGSGVEHPDVAPMRMLHDEQSRAESGLPLA